MPLQISTSGEENAPPTTQYAMAAIADVGLLKMDFLGLTNLTIISKTIEIIEKELKKILIFMKFQNLIIIPLNSYLKVIHSEYSN